MKKKKQIIWAILIGIVACAVIAILVWNFGFVKKAYEGDQVKKTYEGDKAKRTYAYEGNTINNTYEGNKMKFSYDKSLQVTSREQENCTNITVNNSEGTMVFSSVLIQVEDMDVEAFFDSIEEFADSRKEWEAGTAATGVANDNKGTEYYREYEILDIDFIEFKALAQVQELENDYYLLSLAYIEEDFKENKKLARTIMDSIVYSDVEEKGELELTKEISPLFQIRSFLHLNVDMDTDIYMEDLKEETQERMDSIPADTSLKAVEGYEYLMSRDIVSADGNIYKIMVPKDYESSFDENKRFISYIGNGFYLGMYARLLFEEESLEDFLDVNNDFESEMPEEECINVTKSEMIEKDGILYQVCMAGKYDHDGKLVPRVEIVAAIPLDGDDVLSFSLSLEYIDDYNSESIKYLQEIEQYYGVPVTQFAELMEKYQ